MVLCLLVLTLENYRLLRNVLLQNRFRSITGKNEQIKNFFVFKPLTSYYTYSLDNDTSSEIIDILIKEAKKTTEFTIVFHYIYQTNMKLMFIEFYQIDSSHIVSMPLTWIQSSPIQDKIDVLFRYIFRPQNIHQLWGHIDYELIDYIHRRHLSSNIFNVQDKFKQWYNETFPHDDNCEQLSIDKEADGPACTCACRPYKLSYEQWSLSRALYYTFDLCVDLPLDEIQQCLAITHLGTIIRQDWSTYEIEIYRSLQYGCDDVDN